jgi:hypothetical protein
MQFREQEQFVKLYFQTLFLFLDQCDLVAVAAVAFVHRGLSLILFGLSDLLLYST